MKCFLLAMMTACMNSWGDTWKGGGRHNKLAFSVQGAHVMKDQVIK